MSNSTSGEFREKEFWHIDFPFIEMVPKVRHRRLGREVVV